MKTPLQIVATILGWWAILIWPGLGFVFAADYFAPSAAPVMLSFALAFTVFAFWFYDRTHHRKRQ